MQGNVYCCGMEDRNSSQEQCEPWVLKLLGDYVTLRIIDVLRTQELRFTELQRRIGDTNPVSLTDRLKRLEGAGLIERREATVDRHSVTYQLTRQGNDFLPVLRAIEAFASRSAAERSEQQSAPGHRRPKPNSPIQKSE